MGLKYLTVGRSLHIKKRIVQTNASILISQTILLHIPTYLRCRIIDIRFYQLIVPI